MNTNTTSPLSTTLSSITTFPNGDIITASVEVDGCAAGRVYLYDDVYYAAVVVGADRASFWGYTSAREAANRLAAVARLTH